MSRPGESPYSRLGAAQATTPSAREVQLLGRRSPFAVAWEATGEWRDWRALLDASEVADPFDLEGLVYPESAPLVMTFASIEGVGDELVNLTDELGHDLRIHGVSGGAQGRGALSIEDAAPGVYAVRWRGPGDEMPGEAVTLRAEDFEDLAGAPKLARLLLWTHERAGVLDLSMSEDAFTVLWFAREVEVALVATPTRRALVVPPVAVVG